MKEKQPLQIKRLNFRRRRYRNCLKLWVILTNHIKRNFHHRNQSTEPRSLKWFRRLRKKETNMLLSLKKSESRSRNLKNRLKCKSQLLKRKELCLKRNLPILRTNIKRKFQDQKTTLNPNKRWFQKFKPNIKLKNKPWNKKFKRKQPQSMTLIDKSVRSNQDTIKIMLFGKESSNS